MHARASFGNREISGSAAGLTSGPHRNRVLEVRTEHRDSTIIVEVADTGPGIDLTQIDNIFDAFVTTKAHGMGLGLALCRMIVERHEGQLSVSSANPRGATFRIILPRANANRSK